MTGFCLFKRGRGDIYDTYMYNWYSINECRSIKHVKDNASSHCLILLLSWRWPIETGCSTLSWQWSTNNGISTSDTVLGSILCVNNCSFRDTVSMTLTRCKTCKHNYSFRDTVSMTLTRCKTCKHNYSFRDTVSYSFHDTVSMTLTRCKTCKHEKQNTKIIHTNAHQQGLPLSVYTECFRTKKQCILSHTDPLPVTPTEQKADKLPRRKSHNWAFWLVGCSGSDFYREDPKGTEKTRQDPKRPEKTRKDNRKDPKRH
jgi:hypothetical protein